MEDGFKITLELGPRHDLFDHRLEAVVDYHVYNLAPTATNESVLARAKALSLSQPLPVFPHLRVQDPLFDVWPDVERAFLIRGEQDGRTEGFHSTESALGSLHVGGKEIRVACYPEAYDLGREVERIQRLHSLGVSAFVTDFVLDISKLEAFLKNIPSVYVIVSLMPGLWDNVDKLSARFPGRKLPTDIPRSMQAFKAQVLALLKAYGHSHLQLCSWGDPERAVSHFKR